MTLHTPTASVFVDGPSPERGSAAIASALREKRPSWWYRLNQPSYFALLAVVFLALLLIWQLATAVLKLVNPVFLPAPTAVATSLAELFTTGEIYPYLGYSAYEWIVGYAAAAIVGVLIGWAMGTFTPIAYLVGPYAWLIAAAPWIAFQPLYTVWFGFGQLGVIMLVFTASITTIIFNTAMGVSTVDLSLKRAAMVFGASPVQKFWKVVIPGAGPFVLLGLRYALVSSMLAVLLAEIAGSTKGLGGLMTYKTALFQTAAAYGILVLPIVITIVLGGLMQLAARRLSGGTVR